MKIMKSVFLFLINIFTIYFIIKIYLYINPCAYRVSCGSKISTETLKELTKKNIITSHRVFFKSSLGYDYELQTYLYKIKGDFIGDVNFVNNTGLKISTRDLYNSYRHGMIYFYINNIQDLVRQEIMTTFNLKSSEEEEIIEKLKLVMVSMLLTKQASLELLTETGWLIEKRNFKISNELLNGKTGDQFVGALIHLFDKPDFEYLMSNYSDMYELKKLQNNNPWSNFINICMENKLYMDLVYNTIGDILKLVDPDKLKDYELKNNYIFNKLGVDSIIPGETKTLKKFFIEEGKPKFILEEVKPTVLEIIYNFEENIEK